MSSALLQGLAPDGGLYVPTQIPDVSASEFEGAFGVAAVAHRLLAPWFEGDVLAPELEAICFEALDLPVPLVDLNPSTTVMELFHGPSAAFKDFGARFLASCMARIPSSDPRRLTVLVATSGDTGGAVAAAFHGKPNVDVVILYPNGRVSERQAHQLSCWGGNITTLAVDGDFDACQALVKAAFVDPVCQQLRRLTSANSINIGRLLPQMAYHAATALQRPGSTFVIPTGNLGNAVAALWARTMGLPLGDIVLATNANDTLPRLAATGRLEPRSTKSTLANAMDVSRPSNLERLPVDDRWSGLSAVSVDDAVLQKRLVDTHRSCGMVVCPHTAIGLEAREGRPGHAVVAATAHPSKFDTVVEPLIEEQVPIPTTLAELLTRPVERTHIPAELGALQDVLRVS